MRSPVHRDGYHGVCKPCRNAQRRGRRTETPAQQREWQLRANYGITHSDYEEILLSQGGVCAICDQLPTTKDKDRLHVDHDHVTGEIRGLLCSSCNVALGLFADDSERLREAAAYLEAL